MKAVLKLLTWVVVMMAILPVAWLYCLYLTFVFWLFGYMLYAGFAALGLVAITLLWYWLAEQL